MTPQTQNTGPPRVIHARNTPDDAAVILAALGLDQ